MRLALCLLGLGVAVGCSTSREAAPSAETERAGGSRPSPPSAAPSTPVAERPAPAPTSPGQTAAPEAPAASPSWTAYATSSDARTLATARADWWSSTDEGAAAPGAIAVWDVISGERRQVIPLDGDVWRVTDLGFADADRALGFGWGDVGLGVARVDTGRSEILLWAAGSDSSRSWRLTANAHSVFLTNLYEDERTQEGALGYLISVAEPDGELRVIDGPPGDSMSISVLALEPDRAHVATQTALVSANLGGARPPRVTVVGPGLSMTPSPSGRFAAAVYRLTDPVRFGAALYELGTHRRVFDGPVEGWSAFLFASADERVWATTSRFGGPRGVRLMRSEALLGEVPGPLLSHGGDARRGLPVALSPDGERLALLRPGGSIEVWTTTPSPARQRTLPAVEGVDTLSWPIASRIVSLGPQAIVFVDAASGRVVARHGPEQ